MGPLAGGVLTDALGWRSIFSVNLPIGVAAFAGGVARLRESRTRRRRGQLGRHGPDRRGAHVLMFALIRGNALGWASPAIVTLLGPQPWPSPDS